MTEPAKIVRIGDGRVRRDDDDLHRRACKAIWEGNQIVFESLPELIAQIIEYKTWRTFQHKDFASYALDATSNGLGINTNQRLWTSVLKITPPRQAGGSRSAMIAQTLGDQLERIISQASEMYDAHGKPTVFELHDARPPWV